jgi:hypothetical protein
MAEHVPVTILLDHGHNLRLAALAEHWGLASYTAAVFRLIDEAFAEVRPEMDELLKEARLWLT